MKQLGLRIQYKRKEAGLTQEELGQKLGVSRQTIAKWESGGVKHFDRAYADKMARIFNCSPDWLMNMENANVLLTYEAEGREPVQLTVKGLPILGETAKRAQLYQAAIDVLPQNLDLAINLLRSLSKGGENIEV